MKTAVLASLVASAAAFAPAAKPAARTTSLSGALDGMPGSIDLRGKEFVFDPLGLSETYAPLVPFFREAELKHCRTAMLAVVGWIVADIVRIPGENYSFEKVPSSAAAHDIMFAQGWAGSMSQIFLWFSLWELIVNAPATAATMQGLREPGDFGWTWFAPKDDAGYKKMVDSELLNGRLAMFAIGGIATQSVITGHGFPYV